MSRPFAIILSGFYLLLSLNVAVNLHFCGDLLTSMGIWSIEAPCCCEESGMQNDCCEDEEVVIQLDDSNYVLSQYQFEFKQLPHPFDFGLSQELVDNISRATAIEASAWDLPPPKDRSIPIVHCSLVYYG